MGECETHISYYLIHINKPCLVEIMKVFCPSTEGHSSVIPSDEP